MNFPDRQNPLPSAEPQRDLAARDDITDVYPDCALYVRVPGLVGNCVAWRCGLFGVMKTPERLSIRDAGSAGAKQQQPWMAVHLRTMTKLVDVDTWEAAWFVADQVSQWARIGKAVPELDHGDCGRDDPTTADDARDLQELLFALGRGPTSLVQWLHAVGRANANKQELPTFREWRDEQASTLSAAEIALAVERRQQQRGAA